MAASATASASAAAAGSAVSCAPPTLSLLSLHPLKFLPSLLPHVDISSDLRDLHAESAQQTAVWTALRDDLAALLRLPLAEFVAHALYNKSMHRMVENTMQQMAGVWEAASGVPYTRRWWRTQQTDDETAEEEKAAPASAAAAAPKPAVKLASSEQMTLLRGVAKRLLMLYVRLCSMELHANGTTGAAAESSSSAAASSGLSSPPWLTSLFFTTSFSASPLFSAPVLFDLASFYSSVARAAHRPLLRLVLGRAATKLPYAFGQSMQHAVGVLVGALATQMRLVHAPYVGGNSSVKKARFTRDEARVLVRNMASILWPLYAMASIRDDVLRLMLQGAGSIVAPGKPKSASASGAAATPPFLSLLTCLYSLTPLLLLHEMGLKPAQLSSEKELVHLRLGCLKFVDLVLRKALYEPMGVQVQRARAGAVGRRVKWAAPAALPSAAPATSASANTSSTLPAPLSMSASCDTFYHALLLLHSSVHDDLSNKTDNTGLCALSAPMRNLVRFNTASAHNAFLRRANEYFEFDAVLALLLRQAQTKESGTPGVSMGEERVVRLLKLLQQVDPQLLQERIQWPPAAGSSASASSSSFADFDKKKGGPPSSSPSMSRSASSKGGDQTAALRSLADLFPSYSADFLSACLSEYNNEVEATTKAMLEETLPAYLSEVRDKSRYKQGDHMDRSKMRQPDDIFKLSRQSSSGFSSGSGMLDIAVDDEDADAARFTVDVDDDAAFEEFLKRTGRVSKQQVEEQQRAQQTQQGGGAGKGKGGAASVINSFSKSEAALLASKIQSAFQAAADEDEYDDAFDDFENFSVPTHNPLELDDAVATSSSGYLYDSQGQSGGGGGGGGYADGDEPDGSYQRNLYHNARPQQQQQQNNQQRGGRPASSSVRGGRDGSARGGGGGRSDGGGQKWRESSLHPEHVQVPRTFRPELGGGAALPQSGGDVREQWRRDEQRKELFVATQRAQKAQQIAPSKRTQQQEEDYQHGIRQGLIQPIGPQAQGQQAKANQPKHNNQPLSHPPAGSQSARQPRGHDGADSGPPTRGGFSIRGGRGGSAARGGASSALSSAAPVFQPGGGGGAAVASASASAAQARPSFAASAPHAASPAVAAAPASSSQVPARWDDDSGDDGGGGGSGDEGESQGQGQGQGQQGQGRSQAQGGQGRGQGQGQGQPMDLRAKKRKEKNKGIIGNHNRKAAAARKQGMHFP